MKIKKFLVEIEVDNYNYEHGNFSESLYNALMKVTGINEVPLIEDVTNVIFRQDGFRHDD